MNANARLMAATIGLLGLLYGEIEGRAATLNFNVAEGDWNTATSWSPEQVPTSNDNVNVLNGGTVTISAAATGSVVHIGDSAAGRAVIADGAALDVVGDWLFFGSALQTGGTVKMTPHPVTLYPRIYVTSGGVYTQQAGVVEGGIEIIIGAGATASQTSDYVLVNGVIKNIASAIFIGRGNGSSRFIQYGGTVASTVANMTVAFDGTGSGYCSQYGGTNQCGALFMARSAPYGRYVITNGLLNPGTIWMGWHVAGLSEMEISGSAQVTAPTFYVGRSESVGNTGVVIQVGGTVNAQVYLGGHSGYGNDGLGKYTLGGGTLTSYLLSLGAGRTSSGYFTQTGGMLSATTISIGQYETGTGVFHIVGMAPQVSATTYTQSPRGTLMATLDDNGGMRPIAVSGTATLDGILTVGRTNNARFAPGMVVTVMTYNAKSGAGFFQTNLTDGLSCRVNVLDKMITLDLLSPELYRGTIVTIR